MADTITFRGASIRFFDGRQEEGGAFCRVHMTAEFTAPVMAAMDWEDPGHSTTDAKLEGELLATHLILTPNDKMLRAREIQFDISSVEGFKVVTVEEDEVKRRELRFVVRSSQPGVAALVDDYIRVLGTSAGALKVSYRKQEELAFEEVERPSTGDRHGKDSDTGCVSCNNGILFMGDDRSKHANGVKCTATPNRTSTLSPDEAASTLAGVPAAGGATRAKRGRRSEAAVQ